ncbi:MAG: ATP-grasp domain-containing protein, partial [Candidatus Omnitrophica bacterium]|nr:ATP-grasp domain-containing protein [Candidatus Omnitrophota bacterium]
MGLSQHGKVGILMGGDSSEREISLKSGKAVYDSLKGLGLEVCAIDITTRDLQKVEQLLKESCFDCAFIAMHGLFGEDGQIQQLLQDLNIPYTGSGVRSSCLAMDKVASRRIFQAQGLHVPVYKILNRNDKVHDDCLKLRFPVVVKPVNNGSSVGLSIIDSAKQLTQAVELALSLDERALIEEYIPGRELTVGILEEITLPIIEIIPKNKFFD